MARAAMRSGWGLAVALLAVGCGETSVVRVPPDDAAIGDRPLDDGPVWITTGRDSLALVQHVLGAAPPMRDLATEPDLVALQVPRERLSAISEAEHSVHHRCGGFVLHTSEQDAMDVQSGEGRALNKEAPSYTLDNAATATALLSGLREQNVLATVRQLSSYNSRFHTSATSAEALGWLEATWRELALGRADITVEQIKHVGTPQPSLKMTMRGARSKSEFVVLGGHVDSVGGSASPPSAPDELTIFLNRPAPGADDNAAGIAVLTELLRVAVELDYRPARTVVFYAYAAEEIGLVGSREIAKRARQQKQNVVGVLQLDMVNFTAAPEPYIALVRDGTSAPLNAFTIALIEAYVHLPYRYRDCGYACSDYASWTEQGFPSTFPNEAAGSDRNPHVHTAHDTLAQSNDGVVHAMHFAQLGAAFMAELGKGQLGPALDADGSDHSFEACAAADAGVPCDPGADMGSRPASRDEGCSLTGAVPAQGGLPALLVALVLARRRVRSDHTRRRVSRR